MNVRVKHVATNTTRIINLENLVNGLDKSLNMLGKIIIERETGIKDKNGNMVYEGDIIRCKHASPVKGLPHCDTEAMVVWNDTLSAFILFTKLCVFLSYCWDIEIKEKNGFGYDAGSTPENYVCSCCGKKGVRLYRQYQTCASAVQLLCRACALKDQNQEKPDSEREHCIGWLVAAVPTEDCQTFWGFTSVPEYGVSWWDNLPKE